jgi:O-antigen/teichoic acid export membrane protein
MVLQKLKKLILKDFVKDSFWLSIGRLISLVCIFLFYLYSANIFGPNVISDIGFISSVLSIGYVLTESGIGGSFIQRKEYGEEDRASIFYFSTVVALVVSFVILVGFYLTDVISNHDLKKDVWIIILILFFYGGSTLFTSSNTKLFFNKRKVFIEIIANLSSFLIFYASYLFSETTSTVYIFFLIKPLLTFLVNLRFYKIPKFANFSRTNLRFHLNFGWHTTATGLGETGIEYIYLNLIKNFIGSDIGGGYFQSRRFLNLPVQFVRMILNLVIYPYRSIETKKSNLKQKTLIAPIIILVIVCFFSLIISTLWQFFLDEMWNEYQFYVIFLIPVTFFYLYELYLRIDFKLSRNTAPIFRYFIFSRLSVLIPIGYLINNGEIKLFMLLLSIPHIIGILFFLYDDSK